MKQRIRFAVWLMALCAAVCLALLVAALSVQEELLGTLCGLAAVLSLTALALIAPYCRTASDVARNVLAEYSRGMDGGAARVGGREASYSDENLAYLILKTQAEIQSLQQQINPHFLYNTLEGIRAQAIGEGAPRVASMIELLARLFCYNISRQSEYSTLNEELNNISDYIAIQNYRFRDRFRIVREYADIDDIKDVYTLPVLTLQPIVENAIHHGLEKKIGCGVLGIRIFATERHLIIRIQDDGVGMEPEALRVIQDQLAGREPARQMLGPRRGSGIALINVQQRIKLYFGEQYGLSVTSAHGVGTQVELVLPRIPENGQPQAAQA